MIVPIICKACSRSFKMELSKISTNLRCVCGSTRLDVEGALESDPPWGKIVEGDPPLGFIDENAQFAEQFKDEGGNVSGEEAEEEEEMDTEARRRAAYRALRRRGLPSPNDLRTALGRDEVQCVKCNAIVPVNRMREHAKEVHGIDLPDDYSWQEGMEDPLKSAKIGQVAAGILRDNPDIGRTKAWRLATRTVVRYPQMVRRANDLDAAIERIRQETDHKVLLDTLTQNQRLRDLGVDPRHHKTLDAQDEALRARLRELGVDRMGRRTAAAEVPWNKLKAVDANDLKVGDVFLNPGVGVAYRADAQGNVQSAGLTPFGPASGVVWEVLSNEGGTLTARREDGEVQSGPIPSGAKKLKVVGRKR